MNQKCPSDLCALGGRKPFRACFITLYIISASMYYISLVSFVIHKCKICFITKKTNNYNGFEMNIDFGSTKHFFVLMESQRFHGVRKVKKHGQWINQFDTPAQGRRKVWKSGGARSNPRPYEVKPFLLLRSKLGGVIAPLHPPVPTALHKDVVYYQMQP